MGVTLMGSVSFGNLLQPQSVSGCPWYTPSVLSCSLPPTVCILFPEALAPPGLAEKQRFWNGPSPAGCLAPLASGTEQSTGAESLKGILWCDGSERMGLVAMEGKGSRDCTP